MLIRLGSLSLQTISDKDIELLRVWRNNKIVNRYLVHTETISFDDQLKWFSSLDHSKSIYFLLKDQNRPIGLVYADNISRAEKSFEGSIFIGDLEYVNSHVSVTAAILLSHFFFEKLNFELAYSTVHQENKNAIDFDKKLGYKEILRRDEFIKLLCTREDYLYTVEFFKKLLFKASEPQIIYEDTDTQYTFLYHMNSEGHFTK